MSAKLPSVRGQTHCPYLGMDGNCAALGDQGLVLCIVLGRDVPYRACTHFQEENERPQVRWRSRRKRASRYPTRG